MVNDDMWDLIWNRTRGFYERIFEPLKLCKKGDLKLMKKSLYYHFMKRKRHAEWTHFFLCAVDNAETDIVLHRREPKSFIDEIKDITDQIKAIMVF